MTHPYTSTAPLTYCARHLPQHPGAGFGEPCSDCMDEHLRSQNEYWQRVGGHPPPGYEDTD